MFRHIAIRAQYRGFVYKVPDFGINQLKLVFCRTPPPNQFVLESSARMQAVTAAGQAGMHCEMTKALRFNGLPLPVDGRWFAHFQREHG